MGIYLCTDSTVGYEISTPEQGATYLALAGIYVCLEIYCIIETIKICRTQKNVMSNYMLLTAHACIHLLFIRDVVFMPGGALICYGKLFYSIISTELYVIKHVIILIMLYQIVSILLDSYTIPARKRYFKRIIIAMIVVDVCLHTLFFSLAYVSTSKYGKLPRDSYSVVDAAIIMAVFNYFMGYFKKFLKRMSKFVPDSGEYRSATILRFSINACFTARIIYKGVSITNTLTDGAISFNKTVWHGVYMAVYYFFNEMFPCIMIFHTMKKGGKEHYMKLDVMFKVNSKRNSAK